MRVIITLLALLIATPAFGVSASTDFTVSNGSFTMVRDLWGDGSDGAFSFPTPSSGGSCVAVTDCPSICSTCTDRNGSDETEGCICSLPLNANIGTEYTSETATSSIVNFTTFTMGDKNELTINRSQPSAECGSDNGSNLIIRVQGDFTMDDGASGTRNDARINMEGLGECGDWNHSDVDNRAGFAGCGTHAGTGGAAGAIGRNDGSAGEEIAWTWRVGDPWMLNLFGRSGGAPTDNQTSECSASISDYLGPLLGGAGGGGPGCAGTLGSACTGGNKINGNGGGGLAVFVGGTLTAGQYASFVTTASAVGGNGQAMGGSGGGAILFVYKDESGLNVSPATGLNIDSSGGAGSTACNTSPNGCGAGGDGADGRVVYVEVDY